MGSRGKTVKIKITHEPEERELADMVFQTVRRLLPRSRRHETQQDGHRVLYLTAKRSERKTHRSPREARESFQRTKSEQREMNSRGTRENTLLSSVGYGIIGTDKGTEYRQ